MTLSVSAGAAPQANVIRAVGQGRQVRRTWAFYFFFRVLRQAEVDWTADLETSTDTKRSGRKTDKSKAEAGERNLALDIAYANPTLLGRSDESTVSKSGIVEPNAPAAAFRAWLASLLGDAQNGERLADAARDPLGLPDPVDGVEAIKSGLVAACRYEFQRHATAARSADPLLRDARAEQEIRNEKEAATEAEHERESTLNDRSAVDLSFTFEGLRGLLIDADVLSSFPDVFKQGMVARAALLGDVGENSPANWHGELGQKSVHGLLTCGFDAQGAPEPAWARLREEIEAFNNAGSGQGENLRILLGKLFHAAGIELVHIELGQLPYTVAEDGHLVYPPHRVEHFGFRDGISQPFVDMRLGDPRPGGGSPRPDGGWDLVAPGELLLGEPDEGGAVQKVPCHPVLRNGSTYLVFRKLEQDVVGFRAFLAAQRPDDPKAQQALAAQFVGRWPNGASLVRTPTPLGVVGKSDELDLNDFRYAADDPTGLKCPLGAHVRRTNPRDIGDARDVRRHRILRRGMSFGGALIPEDSPGDGEPRGGLFVAMNAHIDLQFELVQGRWLNSGEFLGQAGLGRCPLTGTHDGSVHDNFISTFSGRPITHLRSFVRLRGGDYFFVPSVAAIHEIAAGGDFSEGREPNPGAQGFGTASTPDLFDSDELRRIGAEILKGATSVDRRPQPVKSPPRRNMEDPSTGAQIRFVGRHADVCEVIRGTKGPDNVRFSVRHYHDASQRMMGGANLLMATDYISEQGLQRGLMKEILGKAWSRLGRQTPVRIGQILADRVDRTIRRTRQTGRVDLVQDLSIDPIYALVAGVYGVPGPNWLTELAVALPFSRQHVSQLHPDWLAAFGGRNPSHPGLVSLQVWSILCLSDLIGNVRMQQELYALSIQAGAELSAYIDQMLARARQTHTGQVTTLVDAFIDLEQQFTKKVPVRDYYVLVRLLLAELIGSAFAVIPSTFGSIMMALLSRRANLGPLVEHLEAASPDGEGLRRLIYETARLYPSLPILMRYCEQDTELRSGVEFKKGDWAGALLLAANMDDAAFPEPGALSLDPIISGPVRDKKKYLLFGVRGSDRECWGRERIALAALEASLKGASQLLGLRRIAGPAGDPVRVLRSIIGLRARFARQG